MKEELGIVYKRLIRALLVFISILIIGMLGYRMLVAGTSWFEGLYMTFLTVTTIGFSEVVNLEGNTTGRIFTILIALGGIGVLTYAFSNLAALFIEADIIKQFRRKKMEKAILKMRDHYLICGASQVGLHIANELEKTQRPFVVGDIDENLIRENQDNYSYGKFLLGDCTDEEFLKTMGLMYAKGLFVTTRDDNNNIVICLTARQLKPEIDIVSHSKESNSEKKLYAVGAKKVVSPAFIGGLRMASEMVRPTVTSFLDEMLRDTNENLRIEQVHIPGNYVDKRLSDLPLNALTKTLVLAIKEGNSWTYNPREDHAIIADSYLIVMTSPEELKKLILTLEKR